MRIFVIGAGQVGTTIVEALHEDHEISVLDTEASRLQALTGRFDVAVFEGDGTSRKDLAAAGINTANLVIACTSRDEVNLVAGMFARRETESATTVIRTSSIEYVELWREGQLDVDFVVSSELETAYAISRILGVPAARQTDVFADGQVQVGEFDVDDDASPQVLAHEMRLEQLANHAEWEVTLELAPARRQDEEPAPDGAAARFGNQSGFADPCRTLDQHQSRAAGERARDLLIQRLQLALALPQAGLAALQTRTLGPSSPGRMLRRPTGRVQ